MMAAKLRMSIREQEEKGGRLEGEERVSQGMDVQNGSGDVPAQGLSVQNKDAIFESKRVYDSEKGVVDFKKKVVTSLVRCKRITVPEAAEVRKEAKIQVLINNLEDVLRKSMLEEARCRKDGVSVMLTMTERALH